MTATTIFADFQKQAYALARGGQPPECVTLNPTAHVQLLRDNATVGRFDIADGMPTHFAGLPFSVKRGQAEPVLVHAADPCAGKHKSRRLDRRRRAA